MDPRKYAICLLLLLLIDKKSCCSAAKIFFMIPLTSVSEKSLYFPLINALAKRGHQVTVATIKKSSYDPDAVKNIREFTPIDHNEYLENFGDPKAARGEGRLLFYSYSPVYNVQFCHKVYQNEEFMAVASTHQKYDLIFTNYWLQHCLAGILYQHQPVPFILVSSNPPPLPYPLELTGYKLPMSIVPNPLVSTTAYMSFFERVENIIFDIYWTLFTLYSDIPAAENVYRKYLGQDIPGGYEIEQNVSLIFTNSHFTLGHPVPTPPDVVQVGGMHCRPPKKLPKDLDDFLSGAKEGVIYFSMGSIVRAKNLPKEWLDIFIAVFSKLKQRILFKWDGDDDGDDMPKFSSNVKTGKWLPQQDILGHKNVHLFISHGGGLSTQESLYHGVPMLGLPIFADQSLNMRNAEGRGFAKMLEIMDLTESTFGQAINEILNDPKYAATAKELSTLFQDQLQTPLDRAVYYTEYVIKHKGTKYMRSVGRDLNFVQYYLWDVFAFLFVCLFTLILTVYWTLGLIYKNLFGKGGGGGGGGQKSGGNKNNKKKGQ